jgi:hypothetical protein
MATTDTTRDALEAWRSDQFKALGFSTPSARVLARTRDRKGFFLYWGDVRELLASGASHEQVLRILL